MSEAAVSGVPVAQAIGLWVQHGLAVVLDWFARDGTGGFLALCIVGLAVALLVGFIVSNRRNRRVLQRARAAIVQAASGASIAERRAAFRSRFLDINDGFKGDRPLDKAWQEFRETLHEPEAGDAADEVISNAERPQAYFNLGTLGMTAPLWRAFPNLLIGLGLLLTFVGLIAALAVASDGLGGTEQPTEVLRTLLHAAGAKFFASAAALGASLVLNLVQRWGMAALAHDLAAFNRALEERLHFVQSEDIQRRQLRHLEQQEAQLKRLASDLAMQLGPVLSEAMNSSNGELLAEMRKVTDGLGQLVAQTRQDVSTTLKEQFDRSLSDTFAAMRDSLLAVQTSLTSVPAQLDANVEALRTMVELMKTSVAEAVETSGKATAQGVGASLDTMIGRLDGMAGKMESMLGRSAAVLGTSQIEARKSFEEMPRALAGMIEQLRAATEGVTGGLREAAEESGRLATSSVQREIETMLKPLDRSLSETFSAMRESLSAVQASLASVPSQLDANVGAMRTLVELMRSSIGETVEASGLAVTEGVTASLSAMNERMEGMAGRLETMLERSGATLDASQGEMRRTFEGLPASMDAVLGQLGAATARISHDLQAAAGETGRLASHTVRAEVEGVVGPLRESAARLSETATTLSEHLETFAGAVTVSADGHRRIASDLGLAGEVARQGMEGTTRLLQSAETLGTGLREAGQAIGPQVAALRQAGEGAARALSEASARAGAQIAEASAEAAGRLAESSGDAASRMGAANEALAALVDRHAQAGTGAIERLAGLQERLAGDARALHERLESLLGEGDRRLAGHVARFDDVDDHLGALLTSLNDDITRTCEALAAHGKRIDESFAQAVDTLRESVEELSEARYPQAAE